MKDRPDGCHPEGAKAPLSRHPDRGPNGPPPCHPEGASGASELRDLWSCSQRASHWPQIPRLASDSACRLHRDKSLARDDRVRDRYARSLGMKDCCGLARNDTFYCHPDRGPSGPPPCHPEGASGASELRDLWRNEAARIRHISQIPRLASDSDCGLRRDKSLARDDRLLRPRSG